MPTGDTTFYRSPFLRDFWHLNVAMMTSNNALVPDPDKEDILASKPFDWPFLHLGLRMCGWGDSQLKYYLMGTPIIWWGSTISLGVSLLALSVYLLRWQRKYTDMDARAYLDAYSKIIDVLIGKQANGITSSMLARSRSSAGRSILSLSSLWVVSHTYIIMYAMSQYIFRRRKLIAYSAAANTILRRPHALAYA